MNQRNETKPLGGTMGEDKKRFGRQMRKFRNYLNENTVTCTMACAALGIPQKNATWYKRKLEDWGYLVEVYVAPCKITHRKATYLTTNEAVIRSVNAERRNQLKLF